MPTRPPVHQALPPARRVPRATAAARGYDGRWRRYRAVFLADPKNALCVHCMKQDGRPVPATVVDHIVPHKGDAKLFWDESNHQGLCKMHHDKKTATEDGGFGK